ncbi:hypothetical protein L596_009893 [Steinernema carpocapsae]|uniref:Uncharacterized protein n=1 Tax=Steinernema carpocapsae TaxID=34508 RepID=A0A4U5PGM8_STECR|nr:hypothetical protein L596_009893 [Steinernema carpocapsae]
MDNLPFFFASSVAQKSLDLLFAQDTDQWRKVAYDYVRPYVAILIGAKKDNVSALVIPTKIHSLESFKATINPLTKVSKILLHDRITGQDADARECIRGSDQMYALVQLLNRLQIEGLDLSYCLLRPEHISRCIEMCRVPARIICISSLSATDELLNYRMLKNPNLKEVHVYKAYYNFVWKLTESWKNGLKQESLNADFKKGKHSDNLCELGFELVETWDHKYFNGQICGFSGKTIRFVAFKFM